MRALGWGRDVCIAFYHIPLQTIKADKTDFRSYLLECVKVIGERIADLVAITGSYAEWKVRHGSQGVHG